MTEEEIDQLELVDLRAPVRRDVVSRPPEYRMRPAHLSIAELRIAEFRLGCRSEAYTVKPAALLVAENPSSSTHPDLPMFPWPARSSAGRLLRMSGLTAGEYLGGLYRRNLCDTVRWDQRAAELRARMIVTALFDMPPGLRVVLCGKYVCAAIGFRADFWRRGRLDSGHQAVAVPHPSGLNRAYNDPAAREAIRRWMRWAVLGEPVEDAPC